MPTYEYICKSCNYELEELQSMSEAPLITCPSCGKDTLARVMGGGGGLIFKGSGFYLTDYKDTKKSSTPSGKKGDNKDEGAKPSESSDAKPSTPPPSSPPPDSKKE